MMNYVFEIWKASLSRLLSYYETTRGRLARFFPMLFLFFVVLNIACYWWAMFTAFPHLMARADSRHYYFLIQFPVGILGAMFDSFSFFVTIYIIRRALWSRNSFEYVAHLSLDFVIAILATFWVLFVFSFSGWLISYLQAAPEVLAERNAGYQRMLVRAAVNPTENLRNIYFGLIMGISAMLPTCTHVFMFALASLRGLSVKLTRTRSLEI